MRELEFLPEWYPELHRRRRLLFLQIWATLVLAGGLAFWLFLVNRNGASAERNLTELQVKIVRSDERLEKMEKLRQLKDQLQQQAQIQAKLGVHVESARLLSKVAALMPPSMSLLDIGLETEEIATTLSPLAQAALKDPKNPPLERRLKTRLIGVAPTDVDVANFITELTKVPFFDHVSMDYIRDRHDGKYVMREFQLTFSVGLSLSGGT